MASIAIVDTYYPVFLASHGLDRVAQPSFDYQAGLDDAARQGFGTGSAYASEFRALGWDADLIIPNSLTLQSAWMREHSPNTFTVPLGWRYGLHAARVPGAAHLLSWVPWVQGILLRQIKQLRPDIVYVQDVNLLPAPLVKKLAQYTRLIVGEIASPPPPKSFFRDYNLMVSALPPLVDTFRSWGLHAEYVPLAFDARQAVESRASTREIDAIFVGSFSRHQPNTASLLSAVARRVPGLQIFGSVDANVLRDAGLESQYRGEAWGTQMFTLLSNAKTVINRHGPISGDFAVNMRMFEATGCGAALVTEMKSNLSSFFTPGEEVLAYTSQEEAASEVATLLADPDRLDRIARNGQLRTLTQHTYRNRVEQLGGILESALANVRRR